VRRTWLGILVLALALLVQLTLLNGLHLPGGGVPDLVLILVVALAVASGPVAGTVIGFVTGLCVDLAPPGTAAIGQYAFVFCLAGWAAGLLARNARATPVRTLVLSAAIIAAAEVLTVGFGLLLTPAQVTTAEIRRFLPVSIGYDLLVWPFALYLVVLATALSLARPPVVAGQSSLFASARVARRLERRHRAHEPNLDPSAGHRRDGWVGGAPRFLPGTGLARTVPLQRRPTRLHPGAGTPGTATGLARPHGWPTAPVEVNFSARHAGDGTLGGPVGAGQRSRGRGRPAGSRPGDARFHPRRGEPGGSAARQVGRAGLAIPRARIDFAAHRPDTIPGGSPRSGARTRPATGAAVRVPMQLRTSRSALAPSGHVGLPSAVPKLKFRSAAPAVARRPAATPKFKHASRPLTSSPTTGLTASGVPDLTAFLANRRRVAKPRLRLGASRNRAGMVGGSGNSALRRPPSRPPREPRFGYRRRSVLSLLTRRGVGGQWLARRRTGRRSGVWVIRSQTEGVR
jgi:rod shape-determining protein MreD